MSAGDWWTSQTHADQKEWPKGRVHGWAPGNYSCTCRDCGIHYAGDKRSVQCYPCAAKFVPPPRPETIEEIRADRDRLAAELATTTDALREQIESRAVTEAEGGALNQLNNIIDGLQAELARVRRNHLRRMRDLIEVTLLVMPFTRDPHWWRHRERLLKKIRAALAQLQDGPI